MQNPKIHKTPDGKGYYARFRTPDGRQPRITRRRKSDVQRELNAQLAAIEQGNWINPNDGCVTVTDWITGWHSTRHIVDARGQANYIRLYIEPHIGHIQLRHLTPLRIRQWVTTLDQCLSPDTTGKAHGILDAALKQAVRDRLITANPCDTTPLPRRSKPEHRYLSPEEVHRLADSIDPRYRVLVYTGVRTGLRGSELVALRETNLDLPRRRLTVTHSATEYDDRVEFKPGGKTAAARRTITIDQGLADMLAVHLDQTGLGKVTAIRWEDAPLLFTAPNGGPLYRRNFRKRFWNPAVDASVGRPMRMHDMRHTHVGLILASTPQTSPKIIADRLGHEDIRMTLNTYGHLFGGFDEGIADALGDAFATAEATPDQASA